MRLIDANALIATLEKIATEDETPYFHLDEITQEIFDAPTVDAVPMRHAYWIEDDPGRARFCSAWGLRFHDDVCMDMYGGYRIKPKYCPTWGSIMDGDSPE